MILVIEGDILIEMEMIFFKIDWTITLADGR